jgi:hypothetical protein
MSAHAVPHLPLPVPRGLRPTSSARTPRSTAPRYPAVLVCRRTGSRPEYRPRPAPAHFTPRTALPPPPRLDVLMLPPHTACATPYSESQRRYVVRREGKRPARRGTRLLRLRNAPHSLSIALIRAASSSARFFASSRSASFFLSVSVSCSHHAVKLTSLELRNNNHLTG